jgi:sugar phosphate isomerase/epimerase
MMRLSRALLLCVTIALPCLARDIKWVHLSSKNGALPVPGTSPQQTGLLVARLDKDSPATDFVLSFRVVAPALVWYRHTAKGWDRYVIEKEFLRIEAGGAAYDIDGDGDTDIVFGNDAQGDKLWWWENPYPNFDPNVSWKRHIIKDGGANQHHDQIFGDFKGTGKPQLVFWNQKAKTLFLADIPADPRHTEPWPLQTIFSGQAGEDVENAAKYAEGIDAFDVDGDGRVDLLAGNYWFKYEGGKFRPIKVSTIGGRIKAGKFKPGKYAQVVIGPGDGTGPLKIFECKGDPANPSSWVGRDLLDRDVIHGHTLDLGDIDGDGNLDVFAAEMGRWTRKPGTDNPNATAWILYGNGKGNFRTTILVKGDGWHEGKLADVDGDGDLDVINKPYSWDTPRIDLWLNNGTGRGGTRSGGTSFRHDVGMELWTYRRELTKDLPGTLKLIRSLGFTDIETASFYGHTAAEFRKILDQAGLKCSSIIARYENLSSDLEAVVRDARAMGATYILTAGIPHKGQLTAEDVRKASADFNRWGEKLKAQGLQFGYHPHGFEFVPYGKGNLFDLMLAETKPGRVVYEMDVFWFAHGGANPVRYLQKYPKRFALVHLKDMAKGTPTGIESGRAPNEASVPLGAGQLDMGGILKAAVKAGIKHYYIEDESPAAPQQVPVSVEYLKKAGIPE